MNKKILIIILTFVLITTGTYYKPITAHATITSAGIGTYTAGKVILALLAMAGVATEVSDIESIWQGGQFNAEAYINNVIIFNRDLGLALKAMIASAGSGATTLTMNRTIWNAWKRYCEEEYGTTEGASTAVGNISEDIEIWGVGSKATYSYIIDNLIYSDTIELTRYDCICFAEREYYDGVNFRVNIYYVPTNSGVGNEIIDGFKITSTGESYLNVAGIYINSIGYVLKCQFSRGTRKIDFSIPKGYYIIPDNTANVNSYIATKVNEFRTNGELVQSDLVEVFPVEGVGNETATTAGQDVIGFNNTATQEEGKDVVIEGPLDVALPAPAEMENLLKQLAEQQITYQEFVQALALQAVDTKTETKAQVEAKQQAITVNPSNGVYTVSLNDLFPFCIPFDLYDMLNCLAAEPEAPEVEISLPIGYDGNDFTWEEYTISLSAFDTVAQVGRIFWYILFCIGLMLLTRKLIEG